jgi:predicted glycogen debranching enzyme
MNDPVRIVDLNADDLESREYLVANGLGGFSSATVIGSLTRRYHGLLIAALPSPYGRTVMLNQLDETVEHPDGTSVTVDGERARDVVAEFRLELGLPVWLYRVGEVAIEKRIVMRHLQNTVDVLYRSVGGGTARLKLRPWISFRGLEAAVDAVSGDALIFSAQQDLYEVSAGDRRPPLRLHVEGGNASFELYGGTRSEIQYGVEAERGYASRGTLWSPGVFNVVMNPAAQVHLVASTEPWHAILALSAREALGYEEQRRRRLISIAHPSLRNGAPAELVLAADSFVIKPEGRVADAARAQAMGDEARTVIAGYHWFTDWGRDTMISLEGLTLSTGRSTEAGWILRTFAHYVRDGLIPNMFPEGHNQGLYHTADATLWFFHALNRYLIETDDRGTLQLILPKLRHIVDCHLAGTRFGIRADPRDGLLRQGEEGYQLTWMDAKVDDWVVTPRRGKAVEINALWYNAVKLLEGWLQHEGLPEEAERMRDVAERIRVSFNQRFWSEDLGHLFDVIDGEEGNDPACRPNQLLAIALDNPVLDRSHWQAVVDRVGERLLTPLGLRSLAPGHPEYKARYFGNLRARDAAYHQGTVWGWLIGPYVDAWLKLHPEDSAGARKLLEGFVAHLSQAGIGSISEIFDAEDPYTPRGCISQAWSVAEFLRCWAKTGEPVPE